jgi:Cell division protein FtsI/penicillin-binding protein 2
LNAGFAHARVRVNSTGQIASPLRVERTKKAPDGLQLTIDARIQRAARAGREGRIAMAHTAGYTQASSGAAVVLDPRDGAVKALVSYPGVNQLAAAQDPGVPLASAHRQDAGPPEPRDAGLFPAGSTFKPIVAEARSRPG